MEWKNWIGRNVFIKLNSNKIYSGIIIEVEFLGKDINDNDIYMLILKDKFNHLIGFPNKEINLIQEENPRQ